MNKKQRFAFPPIFICLFLTLTALGLIYLTASSPRAGMTLSILYLAFVIYFWLTEFRTRPLKPAIKNDTIIKRAYFGPGKQRVFEIKNLEGFNMSIHPSNHGSYEYIFIIQQGKRFASFL